MILRFTIGSSLPKKAVDKVPRFKAIGAIGSMPT